MPPAQPKPGQASTTAQSASGRLCLKGICPCRRGASVCSCPCPRQAHSSARDDADPSGSRPCLRHIAPGVRVRARPGPHAELTCSASSGSRGVALASALRFTPSWAWKAASSPGSLTVFAVWISAEMLLCTASWQFSKPITLSQFS